MSRLAALWVTPLTPPRVPRALWRQTEELEARLESTLHPPGPPPPPPPVNRSGLIDWRSSASIERIDHVVERYVAPPTLPLPNLKKGAAELARAVQERASSDLNKLLVQLGPAGESDPAHHAVPITPVAWVGFFSTAAA